MKFPNLFRSLIALSAACTTALTFASEPRVGDILNEAQVTSRASSEVITSGNLAFRILQRENHATLGKSDMQPEVTKVVNPLGQVGLSAHEVRVVNPSPEKVKSALSALGLAPRQITASARMRITSMRFATFAQAAKARDLLAEKFPDAQVTLPVSYAMAEKH